MTALLEAADAGPLPMPLTAWIEAHEGHEFRQWGTPDGIPFGGSRAFCVDCTQEFGGTVCWPCIPLLERLGVMPEGSLFDFGRGEAIYLGLSEVMTPELLMCVDIDLDAQEGYLLTERTP